MDFKERIIGIIIRPDETTKDIINDPRIEEGLLIVGVYFILSIIGMIISISRINFVGTYNGINASTLSTFSIVAGIAGSVVVILFGWLIITGICHFMSNFFGGDGKFYPNMLTAIGYTNMPLIAFTLIAILLTFMSPVTTVNIGQSMGSKATILNNPILLLTNIISLLGAIFSAYLMIYAVKNGEKISMAGSCMIIGILLIVNLIYLFGSVVMALI